MYIYEGYSVIDNPCGGTPQITGSYLLDDRSIQCLSLFSFLSSSNAAESSEGKSRTEKWLNKTSHSTTEASSESAKPEYGVLTPRNDQ